MRSTDRILTTHAGSLPRPDDIVEMMRARTRGEKRDAAADAARVRQGVADVVHKQAEIGLDIVDDGEFGKPSFVTYVRERLGGLSEVGGERTNPWGGSRDARAFPDFYRKERSSVGRQPLIGATAPITYAGTAALASDLDNLKAALAKVGDLLYDQARCVGCRMPQVGGAARRGAQSRATRHRAREGALPHLLQHQHGAAAA